MENILNNLGLTIVTIALFAVIKIAVDQVKEYTKNNIKNEKAKRAIDKALEIVTLAVNTTNQTFVKELKDKNGFGKGEAEEAFNSSKRAVLDMLDKETKEILEEEFENTDKFLNSAIESKVWESKRT
ncbi:hypothetical protein HV819_02335 [Anaerococcus sp. AGMB00486]|uniref:Phage holin n=2 Tax=Anaerococcus TaxID=165779 RepID=A0ABX2N820_9FIRM|nr:MULTISPECIES: hypothetical protein [Anaerococcus]MSS77364.1 hypothetical protein [Anaerococcus porci]NVF10835.1 hypothetical protein [Anaerococcus faecalis]